MNAKEKIGIATVLVLVLLIIKIASSIGAIIGFLYNPIGLVVLILILLISIFVLIKFLKWCFA